MTDYREKLGVTPEQAQINREYIEELTGSNKKSRRHPDNENIRETKDSLLSGMPYMFIWEINEFKVLLAPIEKVLDAQQRADLDYAKTALSERLYKIDDVHYGNSSPDTQTSLEMCEFFELLTAQLHDILNEHNRHGSDPNGEIEILLNALNEMARHIDLYFGLVEYERRQG